MKAFWVLPASSPRCRSALALLLPMAWVAGDARAVGVDEIVQAGQAAYEQYQAYQTARTAVSLEIKGDLTVTPDDVHVSENPRLRLRDVRVTTTGAFAPHRNTALTLVTVMIYANNKLIQQQDLRFEGAPTESQWRKWYPGVTPGSTYPSGFASRYSEDKREFSFDVVADLEAFRVGQNTLKVELAGRTQVHSDKFDPRNWFTALRYEWINFTKPDPKEVELVVRTPYLLSKRPNYDTVRQGHPLNFQQELWVENLASADLGGAILGYTRPQMTTVGADGTVPAFAGTSDNEKLLHTATRVHGGASHSDEVQLPSIDPIRVEKIRYNQWDLPNLNGTEFLQENVTLRSTEVFCVGTGSVGFVPGDNQILVTDGSQVAFRHSRGVRGGTVLLDPVAGPFVPDGVRIEATLLSPQRPELVFSTEARGTFCLRGVLDPGEEASLLLSHTDVFGRTFFGAAEFLAPAQTEADETGVSLDSPQVVADLGQIPLELIASETAAGDSRSVELYFMIRGSADAPLEGLLVEARTPAGAPVAVAETLPSGRASLAVPHGSQVVFHLSDSLGRIANLQLPVTPPILRDQTGENSLVLYLDLTPPALRVHRDGNLIILEYSRGTLQTAEFPGGPWNDNHQPSPVALEPVLPQMFFRVRQAVP